MGRVVGDSQAEEPGHPAALPSPLVVAHRGASQDMAEHTLAAYRRAIDLGADALECDVRLTADGHVVCVHDRRIDRISDGTGVVSSQTLAELQQHDFGSWWTSWDGDDAPDLDDERGSVLTLERLLELVTDSERPVGLAIETKHPNRYAGYLERRVVETLERFGLARPARHTRSPIWVMSFSEIAMRRMRQLAPEIPAVFLMERVPLRCRTGWLPYEAAVAGPSMEIITKYPEFVERLRTHNKRVLVWTVDRMDDLDVCLDLDVDAVVSNRPAPVIEHLARRGLRQRP